MPHVMTSMSWQEGVAMAAAGAGIAAIYLFLLWQTARRMARARNKRAFLFLSKLGRIFLLLVPMVILAQNNLVRFLTLFLSFWITRTAVLWIVRGQK